MKWTITNEENNWSINAFLKEKQQFSRRILSSIKFKGGKILVNEKAVKASYRLQTGDELHVLFPSEERGEYLFPENLPLHIIYEDDYLLVVNKPANLAVIPSRNHSSGTLANRLIHYYDEKGLPYTAHIITRLDRNTSGLVLIAKNRYAHSLLSNHHFHKNVKRKYYAIVEGVLENKQGQIEAPIARKEGSIIERTVNESGKYALTKYEVLKEGNELSLLDVELVTGRTHQIRVHFSYKNHPLLGDDLYGGSNLKMKRQALHCYYLSFLHPISQKNLQLKAPLPEDMQFIYLSDIS